MSILAGRYATHISRNELLHRDTHRRFDQNATNWRTIQQDRIRP